MNHWSVGYEIIWNIWNPALTKMFPLKIELEQQLYGEIVVYEVGCCIKWYLNNIEQKYYGNLTWKMMINNFRVPCALCSDKPVSSCSSHPHSHKNTKKVIGSWYDQLQ